MDKRLVHVDKFFVKTFSTVVGKENFLSKPSQQLSARKIFCRNLLNSCRQRKFIVETFSTVVGKEDFLSKPSQQLSAKKIHCRNLLNSCRQRKFVVETFSTVVGKENNNNIINNNFNFNQMLKIEQIPSISTGRMKNETHVQFHENNNALIIKFDAIELGIEPFYIPYTAALNYERDVLLLIVKSEFTAKIAEKDRERGEIYRSFSATIKGLRGHFDLEIRQSANSLWGIFMHYGNVPQKPINDETAAIDDIVREFDRPENAAKLEALQMTSWRDKLVEVNGEVKQLMFDRFSESASRPSYRMKTTREETDKYYRALISHLNNRLLLNVGIDERFAAFVAELTENIKKFKTILAQSLGRKKKNESNEESA